MPDDGRAYELRAGELWPGAWPKAKHYQLQRRLVRILETRVGGFGEVCMELPYRPVSEFDLRVADVAVVSQERYDRIGPDDNLRGAPELVIEVKSPSNTDGKRKELASLVLANGGLDFWIVDSERQTVTAIHPNGASSIFRTSQSISLAALGGDDLAVGEIFGRPPRGKFGRGMTPSSKEVVWRILFQCT